ncbi:MAG: hypothetical protein GF308_00170 [Candidatus Heimdallarchaeota archaeon]|nr:hypothetical protein [Candidatus Heimdallarchaeota archaeon]
MINNNESEENESLIDDELEELGDDLSSLLDINDSSEETIPNDLSTNYSSSTANNEISREIKSARNMILDSTEDIRTYLSLIKDEIDKIAHLHELEPIIKNLANEVLSLKQEVESLKKELMISKMITESDKKIEDLLRRFNQ